MCEFIIYIKNKECFSTFSSVLSKIIKFNFLILLIGNLGVGKTLFTQYMIRCLFKSNIFIKSPTYSIVETYINNRFIINHLDFYRLSQSRDLENIGFNEYIGNNSICIIEWPELYINDLYIADVIIYIYKYSNNTRVILLKTKCLCIKKYFY